MAYVVSSKHCKHFLLKSHLEGREQNKTVVVTTTKTAENLTRQYRTTIQTAISGGKHNYPYQIGKIDVPQHQP